MASGSSPAARHQGREGQLHALRGVALEDVAVERIEGEEVLIERRDRADLREHAALRRVRIDIVEMLEVGGIFEVAEGRDAVPLGSRSAAPLPAGATTDAAARRRQRQRVAAREQRSRRG